MSALRFLLPLAAALALGACASDDEQAARPAGTETGLAPATTPTSTATDDSTSEEPQERLRLRLVKVASGVESPTYVTAAPGDPERLYVVEQAGRIRVIEDRRLHPEPFLDIRSSVRSGGEQGLFSVAFDPDYLQNRRLYVDYTDVNGDTRVVEYRANAARTRVDETTGRVLLAVDQPYPNHNGGQLSFGPDGRLYVGMGDGGAGGDPENRAQNLSERLGKLLRLDVDDPDADWEIAAYGLRNPWRFSFDRANGDLFLADVGQSAREEVDYLPRGKLGELVNFGWDVFEGDLAYEEKQPNPEGRLVGPVAVYGRDGGCSVTGGFVYRGASMPTLRGRYFYGDYCSGFVWSFRIRDGRATGLRRERFTVDALSSFGEDARGEVYLVSLSGTIYRLTSA